MYTIAPLTSLIGMSLSCATTSGLEFKRTLYSRLPSRAAPAGRITSSALMAALTSAGDSPLAYKRDKSRSTLISRGAPRLINVDLDLSRLDAKGLSPADVSAAINAENVILPAGSARLGSREYSVRLNSSPEVVEQLNDMPIKQVNGAMVYIRDVAYVRDGAGVQTNIVRQNGQHGTYMSVLKNGSASSLAVVNRVKALLTALKPALPPSLDIQLLVDQSLFVRASISGVIREALIAACLTALMILLFLGSWRSTLIIATS